jgi:hypothetical protein
MIFILRKVQVLRQHNRKENKEARLKLLEVLLRRMKERRFKKNLIGKLH